MLYKKICLKECPLPTYESGREIQRNLGDFTNDNTKLQMPA